MLYEGGRRWMVAFIFSPCTIGHLGGSDGPSRVPPPPGLGDAAVIGAGGCRSRVGVCSESLSVAVKSSWVLLGRAGRAQQRLDLGVAVIHSALERCAAVAVLRL